jgi:hypothetical protein
MLNKRSVLAASVAAAFTVLTGCGAVSDQFAAGGRPSPGRAAIAKIAIPSSHSRVPAKQQVTGMAANIPEDKELWLFVKKGGTVLPQAPVITADAGNWTQAVYLNADAKPKGEAFDVILYLVPKTNADALVSYLQDAAETGKAGSLSAPTGSVELDRVTVTRK